MNDPSFKVLGYLFMEINKLFTNYLKTPYDDKTRKVFVFIFNLQTI